MPVNLPVTIAVSKNNGPAPLNTAFTVTNSGSVPLTYSVNGGTPVTLNVNTFHSLPVTYAQPGPVVTTFAIDDGMGNSTTKSMLIEVRDDVVTDLKLRAIWNDVGDKLRAGDVNGALTFITGGATDQYATLFNALKQESKLVNAVNALGTLRGSTVGSDIAEMIISRETVNGTIAFPVWYLRGPDGVWRLESM